ncbi:MAG TPA: hypothetical protein VKU61_12370 [Candidatus Binatia bacterium]|nr:hypothetical protein [Candidatus Binatia bacterium]
MAANAKVMSAFSPCQFPAQALAWFIFKLEAAALSGEMPSAPAPANLSTRPPDVTSIVLTDDEGNESIGAKLAQIFYVEVARKVPWRLADYSSPDLVTLFNLLKYYRGVDTIARRDTYGSYVMYYVADYSPQQAWNVLQQSFDIAGVADARTAMTAIMSHARQFRHGSPSLDGDLGIVSVAQMASAKVSNSGCQSMAQYVMSLAAALNIPGSTVRGYYAGADHRSALFPAVDLVLDHGDTPYDALMDATPARLIWDSYQRWVNEVFIYPPYQGPGSSAAYFSAKYHYTVARLYPSAWVMDRYCSTDSAYPVTGRAYLEQTFAGYASAAELDSLENAIRAQTSGCAVIPPDDPDPNS